MGFVTQITLHASMQPRSAFWRTPLTRAQPSHASGSHGGNLPVPVRGFIRRGFVYGIYRTTSTCYPLETKVWDKMSWDKNCSAT